jgi:transposase-like protein
VVPFKANLAELTVDFDQECREVLEQLRWHRGVCCLRCGSEKISRISTRRQYDCNDCRYRFSVTTGTILNDSHLALPKWFMAVLLMCEAKEGISASQMQRTLGVAHKTAWYLCHRIREAMTNATPGQLSATVEVDQVHTGGKRSGKRLRNQKAMGAVHRDGKIRLTTEPSSTRKALSAFIKTNVADNCERIYTGAHTNTFEGALVLFKRALGSFHQVSTKHLDRYLDECEFRSSNRKNPHRFRDKLTRLVSAKAMPYKKLTHEREFRPGFPES